VNAVLSGALALGLYTCQRHDRTVSTRFCKLITAASLGANLPLAAQTSDRTVAIQVGAVSFVDEGVAPVLDRFQKDANINTLLIATFSYGRGIAARQVPGLSTAAEPRSMDWTNFVQSQLHICNLVVVDFYGLSCDGSINRNRSFFLEEDGSR